MIMGSGRFSNADWLADFELFLSRSDWVSVAGGARLGGRRITSRVTADVFLNLVR